MKIKNNKLGIVFFNDMIFKIYKYYYLNEIIVNELDKG
jgi:hypothetical protein